MRRTITAAVAAAALAAPGIAQAETQQSAIQASLYAMRSACDTYACFNPDVAYPTAVQLGGANANPQWSTVGEIAVADGGWLQYCWVSDTWGDYGQLDGGPTLSCWSPVPSQRA